ncbi:MAG: GNAT family N-acetyltransferase [Candidatus Sulfotelmatobacter sp.]
MRIVLHREIPGDTELHRQWNAVALKTERPEVFYTCEWALAVQSAYQASLKPLLLLGYEGNDLVGVASLATDLAEKNLSFLAATTADYCDFLTLPARRAEFVGAVFVELQKINARLISLANLPADSKTPEALRNKACTNNFYVHMRPAYLCSQVELGTSEQRQQLKATLAGKKKLRRYLREMEKEGPVTFSHLQSWEQIQPALSAFCDAHVARFRDTRRVSSLSTPERRLFLEELARRFDGRGVVTLSLLNIHDLPVAWNYGFQFHGSWFWYQPTFDSRHENNSPGHCLLSRIVMEACDMDGMNVIDLGLGAEGYKERFGNSSRQTLHVTATKSRLRHQREILRYAAATALMRSPRIEAAVRKILRPFHGPHSEHTFLTRVLKYDEHVADAERKSS